jgi:hypothetical protein
MKAKGCKSIYVTFTTRKETCPPVQINNVQLPLGLHLERRLTWHKHIFVKRKQLGIILTKIICYSDASQNSPFYMLVYALFTQFVECTSTDCKIKWDYRKKKFWILNSADVYVVPLRKQCFHSEGNLLLWYWILQTYVECCINVV